MLDFTSALYLGMGHTRACGSWPSLTTGVPAALRVPPETREVERDLSAVAGVEATLLAPSTLHAFWDLVWLLARGCLTPQRRAALPMAIHVDRAAYPIARWGVERAAAAGIPTEAFAHHDPAALRRQIGRSGHRPLVVADGICPGCGGAAPVPALLDAVREHDGVLVLDDTQALGILGEQPSTAVPLGRGGGGSLRWHGVGSADVVIVSSLAKAFGVPIAAVGAGARMLRRFEARSQTRVHCSPPSLCHVHAAAAALMRNRRSGDRLRSRLVALIGRFQRAVAALGLSTSGGALPTQSLDPRPGLDAVRLHERLARLGVQAVLAAPRCGRGLRVSFLITAAHSPADIDAAADALARAARGAA